MQPTKIWKISDGTYTAKEVSRGFGSIELSTLKENQFVTASGLHDGGYIIYEIVDNKDNINAANKLHTRTNS